MKIFLNQARKDQFYDCESKILLALQELEQVHLNKSLYSNSSIKLYYDIYVSQIMSSLKLYSSCCAVWLELPAFELAGSTKNEADFDRTLTENALAIYTQLQTLRDNIIESSDEISEDDVRFNFQQPLTAVIKLFNEYKRGYADWVDSLDAEPGLNPDSEDRILQNLHTKINESSLE